MTSTEPKLISIVIPIFCEEETLPTLHERTTRVMEQLADRYRYELVFINDGSTDRSSEILSSICKRDPHSKLVDLSRNFGHQRAITAGIDFSRGNAVIIMDGDLQDPPEVIPEFIRKWEEGYKVVYGVRSRRRGETAFKKLSAAIYYRLIGNISETRIPTDSGDFRLMDQDVVSVLRNIREENRYLRGLVSWVGFAQTGVSYERDSRFAGETKYPLRKMLRFAWDGITSFSEQPLKLSTHLGLLITGFSLLFIVWIIAGKLFSPENQIQGWTSVMVTVLFLGGTQLLCIGILGEYLGRVYQETKERPLYVVGKKEGFSEADSKVTNLGGVAR